MKMFSAMAASLVLWGSTQLIGPHPMPSWAAIHLYFLFVILLEVSE